jgi:hypothetical protein
MSSSQVIFDQNGGSPIAIIQRAQLEGARQRGVRLPDQSYLGQYLEPYSLIAAGNEATLPMLFK